MATLNQERPGSSLSGSLPLPSKSTTMTLTLRSPAIQPNANAGPAVQGPRRPQDDNDGDDRDRTEGNRDR